MMHYRRFRQMLGRALFAPWGLFADPTSSTKDKDESDYQFLQVLMKYLTNGENFYGTKPFGASILNRNPSPIDSILHSPG
jgi:hypothetical protein